MAQNSHSSPANGTLETLQFQLPLRTNTAVGSFRSNEGGDSADAMFDDFKPLARVEEPFRQERRSSRSK